MENIAREARKAKTKEVSPIRGASLAMMISATAMNGLLIKAQAMEM